MVCTAATVAAATVATATSCSFSSGIATCITGGLSAVQLLQFSSPRRDFGQESKSGKVSFVSSPLDYGSELLGDNKVKASRK